MAGKKGRSGGARPGAGRKPAGAVAPKPADEVLLAIGETAGMSPVDFLQYVQNSPQVPDDLRIRAATAAAPYVHEKKGEGGKKDAKSAAAREAASKFAALATPRLVHSKA